MVKVAVDMVDEGVLTPEQAVARLDPEQLNELLHPVFQPGAAREVIATGLAHLAATLPPWGAVALILVAAMAVTPGRAARAISWLLRWRCCLGSRLTWMSATLGPPRRK